MGLKEKIADAQATEQKVATPTATATTGKTGVANKTDAFKAKGATLRSQMSEDQKALEGSKSDKVAFVCALGDPNRKQARVEGKVSKDSYTVVGYKFKALEDMTVPFAPLRADWKTPLDVEVPTEKQVKAGEVFHLNLVETARLISRIEYAGKFTGEGTTVALSVKSSKDRPEPLPILGKAGAGSIKENMELIAVMQGADGNGNKGTPVIKEEYAETFGNLYTKKKISKKSAGATKKAGEAQADIAAAFRDYYANM